MRTCHRSVRAFAAGLLTWVAASGLALAQSPVAEVWPEIDTWVRLSPAWRASLFVSVSKNVDTNYREGNVIPQVDFAFGRAKHVRRMMDEERAQNMQLFLARGGYLGGRSIDDQGDAYTEYTLFSELHNRIPLKGGLLLSHRVRLDARWLGKDVYERSNRWRYRVMIEKELTAGRASIVPYASAEAYYDSRFDTINRTRVVVGSSVAVLSHTAFEVNGTYQYDSRASTQQLFAVGVILHLFLDVSQ